MGKVSEEGNRLAFSFFHKSPVKLFWERGTVCYHILERKQETNTISFVGNRLAFSSFMSDEKLPRKGGQFPIIFQGEQETTNISSVGNRLGLLVSSLSKLKFYIGRRYSFLFYTRKSRKWARYQKKETGWLLVSSISYR